MPKAIGFKRLGAAIGIAVALFFGVIALSSHLVSQDAAREAVKAQIRAATGLDPEVRGPVSVSIFPPDTVTLSDVVLGDGTRPALAVQVLTARLRLLPLIMGRIEIADVVLMRPRIVVRFARDSGVTNWSPLADGLIRALKPNPDRSALSFSEIHITDGTVVIDDVARNVREALHHVDMSLAWPAISKSFAATGQFAWHNEIVDAAVTVGDFYAALTGDVSGLKFRLTAAPLKVAFDGTVSTRPTLKIDGTLGADAARLRDALRWTGGGTLPAGGFNRFALKARVAATADTLGMPSVNLDLDGNTAEGVLSYAADRASLQGTLAAGAIDLTPYGTAFHLLASDARTWNSTPMALRGLNGTDLDLRLSAAQVAIGSARLGRTAVAVNMHAGRLAVTVGESQAYDGIAAGALTVTKIDGGAEVKSQMRFSDVNLQSCLGQLFSMRHVDGRGNLAFAVEAKGDSIAALARTLAGTATLTATDGAIAGINVEQLLRRLERRPLSGTGDFRTGRTPFDKLTVGLKIADGVATADDVHLDSPAVRLALGGTVSIPARDLDLHGTATLLASGSDPGFELPFVTQGPWEDPLILPDPQALIRRSGAAAPLLDAVRDRKARDAVRSAIEKLTGSSLAPHPLPEGP